MKEITPTQMNYIVAIEMFWFNNAKAPTYIELGCMVDRGQSTVMDMLRKLEKKGLIYPLSPESRSLRTTRTKVKISIGDWPGEKSD